MALVTYSRNLMPEYNPLNGNTICLQISGLHSCLCIGERGRRTRRGETHADLMRGRGICDVTELNNSCASSWAREVPEPLRLPVQSCQLPGFLAPKARTHTSSKTSFNLYCVNALHSTYLTAPNSFAIRSP